MTPKERLRHHVTGAIERGEAIAIEAKEAKETETHHLNGDPKQYTARAISRKGMLLYQSKAFPTREEAVADAWKNRPNAREISSGYGYKGSFDIRYHQE